LEASRGGYIDGRVHQLRDQAIYSEDDKTYLLFSVASESDIAIAEIGFHKPWLIPMIAAK
jgi:hypothetical protein